MAKAIQGAVTLEFKEESVRLAAGGQQWWLERSGDMALLTHSKAIHAEIKAAYGWPRV